MVVSDMMDLLIGGVASDAPLGVRAHAHAARTRVVSARGRPAERYRE
jgi:hypothetical protein